jgi:hypothetical protein
VHRKPGVPHALRRSVFSAMAFIWLHPFVAFWILYATVSIDDFFTAIQDGQDSVDDIVRMQLSVSCFSICVILTIMRTLHKGFRYHLQSINRLSHMIFRFGFASLHLIVTTISANNVPENIVGEHAIIAFSFIMIEVLVNMNSTKKKIRNASVNCEDAERSSTVAQLRKSLGTMGIDRDINDLDVSVTIDELDEDESFYVDYNDRGSFVRRSSLSNAVVTKTDKDIVGEEGFAGTGIDPQECISPLREPDTKKRTGRGSVKLDSINEVLLDEV